MQSVRSLSCGARRPATWAASPLTIAARTGPQGTLPRLCGPPTCQRHLEPGEVEETLPRLCGSPTMWLVTCHSTAFPVAFSTFPEHRPGYFSKRNDY